MSDSDNDDDYNEEEIFMVDYANQPKQWERVFARPEFSHIETLFPDQQYGMGFENVYKKLFKSNLSDIDKFHIIMGISLSKINRIFELSEQDMDILIDQSYKINKVRFKNPICYILGYCLIQNKNISMNRLNTVIKNIGKFNDITVEDVIRYARYWLVTYFK